MAFTFISVVHQTMCDGCRRENFTGLRYKCEKCHNYSMCQECFWLGRFSPPHSIDHQVKEYTSFVSDVVCFHSFHYLSALHFWSFTTIRYSERSKSCHYAHYVFILCIYVSVLYVCFLHNFKINCFHHSVTLLSHCFP